MSRHGLLRRSRQNLPPAFEGEEEEVLILADRAAYAAAELVLVVERNGLTIVIVLKPVIGSNLTQPNIEGL